MSVTKWCQPGVKARECWSWAFYDFANSGYTTVVLTAVFNAYFVSTILNNASYATLVWTLVVGASNFISMIVMPVVGSLADARANKKRWLFGATLACVVGTMGLFLTGPGTVFWAGFMIVISNVAYNMGESLCSAFLPELAKPEDVGKVSGWGWGLGYIGGLVALGLSIPLVGVFGGNSVPYIMLLTAAIYAVAATPLFIFLKERSQPRETDGAHASSWVIAKASFREVGHTLKNLPLYRDFAQLALTGFFFQCGVSVVIALSAVYAEQVMGFKLKDTLILMFVVNITAAVGAIGAGWVQDRIGAKLTLNMILGVWLVMIFLASSTQHLAVFWVAANLAGLAMGACQSIGRSMVALLAPDSRRAEFFSFWNMALWFSSLIGPVTYGLITWVTEGNHRLAILVTGIFFVCSLVSLLFVNLERGATLAKSLSKGEKTP